MASSAAEVPRPRLRLIRSGDRVVSRALAVRLSRRNTALLLVPAVALVATGLIMVLSASSWTAYTKYGSSFLFFRRQAAYAVVGAGAMFVTSRMRYTVWRRLALPYLGVVVLLLVLVLQPSAGTVVGGSARWLTFGPVNVQPSEFAKLALIMFVAALLSRKWNYLHDPAHLALPLLPVVSVVCGLVILQPDLGTALILSMSVFLLLYVAGVRMRYLFSAAMFGSVLSMALILSEPYRRVRFLAFLHPRNDPGNTGWHLIQSLIALGSGGWFGVGLGASRQDWGYVPNAHTDFIFSILGEELGLVGEIAILTAFGLLIFAGIRIAARAPDTFGRLLAAGIVGWMGIQIVVNLGAVTGLLPITGVPLPFLSYGGSSLVVSMASVGILVSISRCSAPAPRRAVARRRVG